MPQKCRFPFRGVVLYRGSNSRRRQRSVRHPGRKQSGFHSTPSPYAPTALLLCTRTARPVPDSLSLSLPLSLSLFSGVYIATGSLVEGGIMPSFKAAGNAALGGSASGTWCRTRARAHLSHISSEIWYRRMSRFKFTPGCWCSGFRVSGVEFWGARLGRREGDRVSE